MNIINRKVRIAISDQLILAGIPFHGELNQPDFLNRLFDLKALPSNNDNRFHNAYDDIYQHTVRNSEDYAADWIYTDPRINLAYVLDQQYIEFLNLTLDHRVRQNFNEEDKMIEIYNFNLNPVGYNVAQISENQGRPVWAIVESKAHVVRHAAEIIQYFNSEYVARQFQSIQRSLLRETDIAIGTAKELLETACKSILKKKERQFDKNWNLLQLINATIQSLEIKIECQEDQEKANDALKKMISGMSLCVHGIAELRNSFGSGHGKSAHFKPLDPIYARLFVNMVTEIIMFTLAFIGEDTLIAE